MRPQARLSQAVGGDGLRLPQRRAGEDDGPRQAVEQGNVVRRQAQLPQLVVAAARGGGRMPGQRPRGRGTARRGRGPPPGCRPPRSRTRCAPSPPGSRRTRRRRLKTGSSTGPVVPDRRHAAVQGGGIGRRPAAAQEPRAVRLVLELRSPGRPPPRRGSAQTGFWSAARGRRRASRAAGARDEFRLQEQLREGRVGLVGAAVIQAHLGVAGQVELAGPVAVVDERDQRGLPRRGPARRRRPSGSRRRRPGGGTRPGRRGTRTRIRRPARHSG